MTAYEKRKAALLGKFESQLNVSVAPPTCTSYIKNFKLCGEPAIYRELCGNKVDYEFYCEHCAAIVRTWGHNLEVLKP